MLQQRVVQSFFTGIDKLMNNVFHWKTDCFQVHVPGSRSNMAAPSINTAILLFQPVTGLSAALILWETGTHHKCTSFLFFTYRKNRIMTLYCPLLTLHSSRILIRSELNTHSSVKLSWELHLLGRCLVIYIDFFSFFSCFLSL